MSVNYQPPADAYDEAFIGKVPRNSWQDVWQRIESLGQSELQKRTEYAAYLLDENDVTFGPSGQENQNRLWKLDLIPMIFSEADWKVIQDGIDQRARLYELILQDLFGPQELLKQRVLPPEIVFSHTGFMHVACGLHQNRKSLTCYGVELARSHNGQFWVMADRSNAPAGMGFALENRIVTRRTLPQLSHDVHLRKLSPFFSSLQETLKAQSPRKTEHPRIVLLSGGPGSPFYFEDVYLARYLGFDLAQGSDLAVRDDQLFLKTLAGLIHVDVVLLRGSEREVDPVECGGGAPHGVPGLLQAIRAGNVVTANLPGSGIIEAPVFMAVLPQLCQHLLGEELKIPSIATWWCQNPDSRKYVLDNLDKLVIKPSFHASGGDEMIAAKLTKEERQDLQKRIQEKPYHYIGQELITRSASPVIGPDGQLESGHIALRTFAVATGDRYNVMPGGLVRVAKSSGPMELSIAGGETSKDLWILSSQPDKAVSLLPAANHNVELKRTTAKFPSRVADDLFWLGQSIDRSDLLGRLLRTLLVRIESPEDFNEQIQLLLRVLIDVGGIESGFTADDLTSTLDHQQDSILAMISENSNHRGLFQTVSELFRLSSVVRDWISPETWHQLHRSGSDFLEKLSQQKNDSLITECLDRLILSIASSLGLIENGMIRGPAWRFLDLGRRIERGRTTAKLTHSLLDSLQTQSLKLLIEIFDCQMTYRARYLDDIQQNAVLDLCVTDITNPRSIIYQLEEIASHVDQLPHPVTEALRNEEKRLAMSAVHKVRMLTSEDLGASEPVKLGKVLKHVEKSLSDLANLLERKYLLHSGVPRQIVDSGEIVS